MKERVSLELAELSHSSSILARQADSRECNRAGRARGQQCKEAKLTIGIQIRLGDKAFKENGSDLDWDSVQSAGWFTCAQQIENAHKAPNQQALWYLISDSNAVRIKAKEVYGKKLLTTTTALVQHSANFEGKGAPEGRKPLTMEGMQITAGEHWTFGMTDYQVCFLNACNERSYCFQHTTPLGMRNSCEPC